MATRVREDYPGAGSVNMVALKNLPDWRVAEGDPDIRGWEVGDPSGQKLGQIEDLIIDTRSGEAAYALIAYGGSLGIGTKRTLMPIDDLQLDPDHKRVVCHYPMEALRSAPEYQEGKTDFGTIGGFWTGVAAAAARGERSEAQPERRTVLQRLVHPEERGTREEAARTGEAQPGVRQDVRKVRLHVGRRSPSGDESVLNNGDVLTIPMAGQGTVLDEIFIRLEAVEEDEERGSRQFRI